MTTKRVTAAAQMPVNLDSLPDDGTPTTFSFAKTVGTRAPDDSRAPTAEDYEEAEWELRRQGDEGWEFVENVQGMPLDNELRENYGPGKYEMKPLDPRSGKAIERLRRVRIISATIAPSATVLPFRGSGDEGFAPFAAMPGSDEVPAWMRWQMQQSATAQQEQQRKADEALQRQRDFEEKLALKEFDRQEREERERTRREQREEKDAERRDARFNDLLTAGITLATSFFSNRSQPTPQRDVNEVLLKELMEERRNRNPQANTMRDNLDLLLVLDKLAQSRAEASGGGRRRDDDDEDDGLKDLLMGMLPAMLGRGGQGGQPQMAPEMIEQMVEQALQSPALIEKIAMRNPKGMAETFMAAVKKNPVLEKAVMDAVDAAADDDDGKD